MALSRTIINTRVLPRARKRKVLSRLALFVNKRGAVFSSRIQALLRVPQNDGFLLLVKCVGHIDLKHFPATGELVPGCRTGPCEILMFTSVGSRWQNLKRTIPPQNLRMLPFARIRNRFGACQTGIGSTRNWNADMRSMATASKNPNIVTEPCTQFVGIVDLKKGVNVEYEVYCLHQLYPCHLDIEPGNKDVLVV